MDVFSSRKRSVETVATPCALVRRQHTDTPGDGGSCPHTVSEALGPTQRHSTKPEPRLTLDIFKLLEKMEPLLPAVDPGEQDVKLSCASHTDCRTQANLLVGKYVVERDVRDLMAVRQVVTGRVRTGSKSDVNSSKCLPS